ncbi:hypothetical protein [Caedibacter taeniospiralis]|uniref:hypothetical protein n=1 Tax=Caedibacter taeniospiralis TaxID=28907 RepID=UPI003898E404
MRQRMATLLQLELNQVNIKVTTTESLGLSAEKKVLPVVPQPLFTNHRRCNGYFNTWCYHRLCDRSCHRFKRTQKQ